MWEILGVFLLSTIGLLLALVYPRSAPRRHLVLCTTLAVCLIFPALVHLRRGTNWTWLAIPYSNPVESQNAADFSLEHLPVHQNDSTSGTSTDNHAELATNLASPQANKVQADQNDRSQREKTTEAAGELAATHHSARLAPAVANRMTSLDIRHSTFRWAAIMYIGVAVILLVRIVAGLWVIWRIKQRALVVNHFAEEIPVAEAEVAIPMAVGFGRHLIILPRGFRQAVEPPQLHDVLLHEAEHLRRGDHWVLLIQRLIAAVYWPVVTIHLVNRALTRAREELCDNAVLTRRDPASYGRTLLTVAQRTVRQRNLVARLAPSVIGNGELERRVAGILDERRDRRTRVARPTRWVAAIMLCLFASLAVTTRGVAIDEKSQPSKTKTSSDTTVADDSAPPVNAEIRWTEIPKVDLENPLVHRGIVLGPDGKPVAGASVYAASTIELFERDPNSQVSVKSLGKVRAVTDSQGRFEFEAQDLTWVTPANERKRWETLLVASKEGVSSGWLSTFGDDRSFRSHWHPHPSKEVAVRTHLFSTLTGRLLLNGGDPLPRAHIRLTGLMAPFGYDLNGHIARYEQKALGLFATIDYAEQLYRPWVLPGVAAEIIADDDGKFEFPGLPEGYIAQIEIIHPQAVTTTLRAAIRNIEPVYRAPFGDQGERELTLYGSGFTANLEPGIKLQGKVASAVWGSNTKAVGVIVAQANHNDPSGMSGERVTTDAEGRFEMTGLASHPEGYELAFVGSFAAPWRGHRQKIFPGREADIRLTPAVRYRLTLTDRQGNPVDRSVRSIIVQHRPGMFFQDVKATFNVPERVAAGVYEGIVPAGPAAVLVDRRKSDRPVAINPKEFFEPGRTDWTLDEERFAYGDAWRIVGAGISETDGLLPNGNPTYDQLDLAAAVLTNARTEDDTLELKAVVDIDPPVEFSLVDEAGQLVEKARIVRQLTRFAADGLPSKVSLYGLHPERAEYLMFRHDDRGLIGVLTTTWKAAPIQVVLRPAATLRGRFVDKSGKLNFDFGARITGNGVRPDTYVAGQVFNTKDQPGQRSGEFELVVPPGVELRADFVRKAGSWLTRPTVVPAFGPLTPKPGEIIDLGDLTVP